MSSLYPSYPSPTSPPPAAQRQPSTVAQWVTAVCTALLLLCVGGFLALGLGLVKALGTGLSGALDDVGSAISVRQAFCLPYSAYVLDRHEEGLTPAQITAVIALVTTDRSGPTPQPVPDAERLDVAEGCGTVEEVLRAAGRPVR